MGRHGGEGEVGGGLGEAVDQLDLTVGELLSDVDTKGDADQFSVLELYAGALVAVVEQHIDARGFEFGGELLSGSEQRLLANVGDGDDDLIRRDGRWQSVGLSGTLRVLE